ncbi:MAG: hypothetical protein KDB61_00855 [Planctomycetes bacterium]|nr:hypothetical protein [Planctomycetota bacterium]
MQTIAQRNLRAQEYIDRTTQQAHAARMQTIGGYLIFGSLLALTFFI